MKEKKADVKIIVADAAVVVEFGVTSMSDSEVITSVWRQISEYITENRPQNMIVDFKEVKFFSSQVLGVLLDIRAKLKEYDGDVVISAINPQLHRVFRITNLDKVFSFFPDRQKALDAVQAK